MFPSYLVARLQVQVSKLYKGFPQVYLDYCILTSSIASFCTCIGVALCQPCESPIRQELASQDLSLRLSRHCSWYSNRKLGQLASRWLAAKKRLERDIYFIILLSSFCNLDLLAIHIDGMSSFLSTIFFNYPNLCYLSLHH